MWLNCALVEQIHHLKKMTNKFWNIGLLALIPLSELKAIFYHVDKKVDWYLLLNHKRWLCNVVEDYANAIIFIYVFLYMLLAKKNKIGILILRFLIILSILDFIHLFLFDMQTLSYAKYGIAIIIWSFLNIKKWL